MIVLIAAFFVMLTTAGGGMIQAGDIVGGLVTVSIGAIGLGTLFASIQTGQTVNKFDTREGLTVRQLKLFIEQTPWVSDDVKVYVGDQGVNLAGYVFSCLLDGGKALVIERKAESETPATKHDLF
jgi:hypothetical protein